MARDEDFLYASGRIKALETRLLSRNIVQRVLEAQDLDAALRVLGETDYAQDFEELESVYDFEKALENSMKRTLGVIRESLKDHRVVRFFTLKYDYHNLKVVLKSRILGVEAPEKLSTLGEVPAEELFKLSKGESDAAVPKRMRAAFEKAAEAYEETRDPQQVDLVLDRALYDELNMLVREIGHDFLKSYLDALVDLTNIKTLVRLKYMQADLRTLEKSLLPGGSIDTGFFKKMFQEPVSAVIDALAFSRYSEVVREGLESWVSTNSPAVYERLSDDFLLSMLRKGLYKPFGLETVVGYLGARENELKILRVLMVGKINGISEDMIRERLRDVYV
ncbi:V-type ATP synthase subunit C [Thermosediminibacter oceani]|uniref:H+transporting two-sector ATPase C (AC39) subunit n=1 Tax=Thermosediminibacter oceani (strain ATCC BAA-1034 / DSM 16646 / JW/IW-1228P) TaxID=555079 RepID=D9RZY5_THEOJ|nr:V-type ATP synthase subunit C [Thermosediminibacter oceani]ADL08762.1 H+transporting two-sector ATPase C (AC39) subunit [Thermosediminibacter oceani DSM 16646]